MRSPASHRFVLEAANVGYRDHHLRLQAQRLRVGGHAQACRRRRAWAHGDRQHLRRDAGKRAPGAAGDPQGAPGKPRRQDRGHRLRRADRSRALRRHGRGGPRHRQSGEDRSADLQGSLSRRDRAGQGQRHHVGEGDRGPSDRGLRRPGPRLCADPERLRPPLHLLHHSIRARAVALGAGGRGGGAGAKAGRERLCRDRADRRRHHRLWRGPSRRDHARQTGDQNFEARAGAEALAALLHRFGRGRRRAARGQSPKRSG